MQTVSVSPVLAKKSERPPSCCEAVMSQEVRPMRAPPRAPADMAGPVRRAQNMLSVMGMTAEPMSTPMNRYTQPRLTWGHTTHTQCAVLWSANHAKTIYNKTCNGAGHLNTAFWFCNF